MKKFVFKDDKFVEESFISEVTEPEIHLNGNLSAILDGAKGILEYNGCCVRVGMGKFSVRISGNDLTIKTLSSSKMMVCGFIASLDFVS